MDFKLSKEEYNGLKSAQKTTGFGIKMILLEVFENVLPYSQKKIIKLIKEGDTIKVE